jgi:hypothetical protein
VVVAVFENHLATLEAVQYFFQVIDYFMRLHVSLGFEFLFGHLSLP